MTPEKQEDSLSMIFIRRAYWAVNSIHNEVFFKQAGETYVVPDREDMLVAMLTEQDSHEVALLRIARELIAKAEKKQPDKKLNIRKQDKAIIEREPEINQANQEAKRKPEETSMSEKILESEKDFFEKEISKKVSIEENNKIEGKVSFQRQELEEHKVEAKQGDI